MNNNCLTCNSLHYCTANILPIVNDTELSSSQFVRYTRNFAASLDYKPSEWVDHLYDLRFDFTLGLMSKGIFINVISLRPFEISDEQIDNDEGHKIEERYRNWFRDIIKPVPDHVTPYVRRESRERFRVFATLLLWTNPQLDWPRILPANDNYCAANDNAP